jgi:hypothetical protein
LASASTVIATQQFSATIPSFTTPPTSSETIYLSQFDAASVNAAIQAACPAGHTCSSLTLTSIGFELDATSMGSVDIVNVNGTAKTVAKVPGQNYSIYGTADVTLVDPLGISAVESIPTFTISGAQTVSAHTSKTFSGTGSDSETGSIDAVTGAWSNSQGTSGTNTASDIASTYIGTGNIAFTLNLLGQAGTGALSTGVTTANNIESITGTQALVTYTYEYSDTVAPSTPEPVSMLLLGSGLVAVGLISKRVRG